MGRITDLYIEIFFKDKESKLKPDKRRRKNKKIELRFIVTKVRNMIDLNEIKYYLFNYEKQSNEKFSNSNVCNDVVFI